MISKLIPVNIYPDTYGKWRSYYGSAWYGTSYVTNSINTVWYEELFDAVALHDVKDLAIDWHVKAKDLIAWYEAEFDVKL